MLLLVIPDTTALSYWLSWRVLLCAIWVLTPMVVAVFIICKYEGLDHLRSSIGKTQQDITSSNYGDKAWRPCVRQVHPIWLLAYRVIAFCLLLGTQIVKVSRNGFTIFYYYTQWTYTFLTFYFGVCVPSLYSCGTSKYVSPNGTGLPSLLLDILWDQLEFGSLFSVYGCYQYHKMGSTESNMHLGLRDAEQEYLMPLTYGERPNTVDTRKFPEEMSLSPAASICSHLFQIIYQMNAGAVMLTDCVYWSIIFPFLTIKDYTLNFMTIDMHTLNAVLLLGDTALNSLPFPWFRISYFILWTGTFVIFQWIVHACVSMWWPYPFLDLSSPYAPLWYLLIGLMHVPCYGIFMFITKMKQNLLSKWFPQSSAFLR